MPANLARLSSEEALGGAGLPDGAVDRREAGEEERDDQSVEPDADLQQAVDPQRAHRGSRPSQRPATKAPSASPPMKVERTVLVANWVDPKIRINCAAR